LGYFFSKSIANSILNDINLTNSVFYCFIISSFEALLVIPLTIARLQSKAILYTIISISNLIINLVLQFYFLSFIKVEVDYIFISKAIAPLFLVLISLPYVIKNIKPTFNSNLLKNIYKFSFPLMAASLLAMLLNSVNRYILVDFVSKPEVAIFTLGYSIGSVTNFFIVSPFFLAFSVISWKKLEDDNANRFFTKTSTYLFYVMIYVSIIISLFIPELVKIFILNPELWDSVGIVRIILFSNCIAALYFISIQSYYFTKRTDLIFWVFTICLSFNIITNYIFVRFYGVYGSAILSVLSYLLLIIISYNLAKRLYFIKFEKTKLHLLSIIYIIVTYICFYFKLDYSLPNIFIKILVILTFPFFLYLFHFYEFIELDRIKMITKKIFRLKK
jgi:O-antigen/teichoic acid export membrane protein